MTTRGRLCRSPGQPLGQLGMKLLDESGGFLYPFEQTAVKDGIMARFISRSRCSFWSYREYNNQSPDGRKECPMKSFKTYVIVFGLVLAIAVVTFAEPSLTIYNQDFAVVRDQIELSLKQGENEVTVTDITAQAEPESVILRDPAGKYALRILEQNYRADPCVIRRESMPLEYWSRTIGRIPFRPSFSCLCTRARRLILSPNRRWFAAGLFEAEASHRP